MMLIENIKTGPQDFFILLLYMNNGKKKKKLCRVAQQFFDSRIKKYFYCLKILKK